ncbi:hydroxymethylglutaryl-CoA reductase, degradative [Pediococcus siamensis]|uniref:hydroxymethylglutaryl-CoA reductase, degradative n=1 Tax=Pediococcus siamensis TaxID=381829 RepID=UPI0039A061A4
MDLKHFYKQDYAHRLAVLKEKTQLTTTELQLIKAQQGSKGSTVIENYLTDYPVPEGIAVNFKINGQERIVPMVTEEPSVIAAASNGAKLTRTNGIQATTTGRLMMGQVLMAQVTAPQELSAQLADHEAQILAVANAAHPSIVKRGGGAKEIRVRQLEKQFVSLDVFIDTREAMGANMINSMLEAVAHYVETTWQQTSLMAILSNLADRSLASATCQIPVAQLASQTITGEELAKKIVLASQAAQVDPYRATTHNKGIMNGIDAVVMATGNDWRGIESAAHAFAASSGQYRGLSTWELKGGLLIGKLTLPLPVGFVGGSIKLNAMAQLNQHLLQVQDALELEEVIVSVGLAQNLAALKALVSEGIQRGHMRLQAKSLLLNVGAHESELTAAQAELSRAERVDEATAKRILNKLRNERNSNGEHKIK